VSPVLPTRLDILVVEDDASLRNMLGTVLLFEGFQLEMATNGAEGLSFLRRKIPDLILLDLVLPWVNGIEVLATLRGSPATEDMPVIVMTGTPTVPRDLHGLGPIDIVHKPIDPDMLLALIADVLRRPRGRSRKVQIAGPAGSASVG
jgi:two-component system response regulator MprA